MWAVYHRTSRAPSHEAVTKRRHMGFAFKSGAIIPGLLMLPNVAWLLFPAPDAVIREAIPTALAIAENVSRVVVLALPCFYALDLRRRHAALAVVGMVLALFLYYAAWIRYFAGGGDPALLSASLVGIPAPLALAPIALLTISSYAIASRWMLVAALVFGAMHIWSSTLSN